MQHTTRTLRLGLSALGFAAGAAALGCSKDYALGDLGTQDLPVAGLPAGEQSSLPNEQAAAAVMTRPDVDFTLAPLLPLPDVTMASDADINFLSQFNRLVSGVGDLDGDGFQDFASQGFDQATSREFVHVRYGGPRPKDADEAFALQESGVRLIVPEFFTRGMVETILPAGDVDGDGYADMLVGTGRCVTTTQGEGAYLLYGGPERLSGVHRFDELSVYLPSPHAAAPPDPSNFCTRGPQDFSAALGDFDGDGFDDFVLGDPPNPEFTTDGEVSGGSSGALYLFYGGPQRLVSGTSWSSSSARFVAPGALIPNAIGDINADGRSDLILHAEMSADPAFTAFLWIPGSSERRAGDIDVLSSSQALDLSLSWTPSPVTLGPNDVDGDGITDLVASAGENQVLFFGRSGLFDTGVDLSQDVVLLSDDVDGAPFVEFAGDRDGDGDADLLSHVDYDLVDPNEPLFKTGVAFLGGSKQRFSGSLSFPAQSVVQQNPGGTMIEQDRFLRRISFAGDLDGDGVGDLLTTSLVYTPDDAGEIFYAQDPRLHIHYGRLGSSTPPLR